MDQTKLLVELPPTKIIAEIGRNSNTHIKTKEPNERKNNKFFLRERMSKFPITDCI